MTLSDQFFLVYGVELELYGGLCIVASLSEKMHLLSDTTLWAVFMGYFRKFPTKAGKNTVVNTQTGGMVVGSSHATANLTAKSDPADLKKYIDNEILNLKRNLQDEINNLRSNLKTLSAETSALSKKTKAHNMETKNLIIETSVKDIQFDVFGLSCVAMGLILSNMNSSLEKLFQ